MCCLSVRHLYLNTARIHIPWNIYKVHPSVVLTIIFQPTISLEMAVPSQGHYGFHSFPVVD